MKIGAVTFGIGFLFAVGLGVSGMVNPNKVLAFLDVAGRWDPSLLFVMAGAVLLNLVLFRWILARPTPVLQREWSVPTNRTLDARLVLGSILFGVGWGLAGFCPAPALTGLAFGKFPILIFVAAMAAGTALGKFAEHMVYSRRENPKGTR